MKKLFFALFFTATLMANAQLCTPDTTIKVPGFYPSQLADGAVVLHEKLSVPSVCEKTG